LLTTGLVSTNSVSTNTIPFGSITLLAADPATPSVIYAGTRGGLFKSLDSGTNWIIVTNGLPALPVTTLAISPASPSTLYVGLFNSFGAVDAFLTKFTSDLSSVIYSVTFGGSGTDQGLDLALDPAGEAFVVGFTTSLDFPISQPVDYPSSFNSGLSDAFVTAVNAAGSGFLYSTYLGGFGNDFGRGIAVDSAATAWLVGETFSPDFPTVFAIQPDFLGPSDAFLAKISMTYSLVNVTFQTTPPGIPIFVDGLTNTTPVTFQWPLGSFHTVAGLQNRGFVRRRHIRNCGLGSSSVSGAARGRLRPSVRREGLLTSFSGARRTNMAGWN